VDVETMTDAEVAEGYFRFCALSSGDRAERLLAEHEYAEFCVEVWNRAVWKADPFPMLAALIDRASDDELGTIGDGVLESLIRLPEHWPGLEVRCRQEPRWHEALRCVCASPDVVARMPPALRGTLTHDPGEHVHRA
jgi:hypothetical protein